MIGVFDSGVGGISVFKELVKQLPQYDYVYLGDTARAPYGNKSAEAIIQYTRQALNFLFSLGCGVVVLACNTASAKALPTLVQEEKFKSRLLGVIQPTARMAALISQNRNIGVIGTRATIQSGIFFQEIKKNNSRLQVFSQAAPLLVPLVEEGWVKRIETRKIIKYYLRPLKKQKIDTLVLGCTHYPFLAPVISQIIGRQIKIVSALNVMPKEVEQYFKKYPAIKQSISQQQKRIFYTTDEPKQFLTLVNQLAGKKIVHKAQKISLV